MELLAAPSFVLDPRVENVGDGVSYSRGLIIDLTLSILEGHQNKSSSSWAFCLYLFTLPSFGLEYTHCRVLAAPSFVFKLRE